MGCGCRDKKPRFNVQVDGRTVFTSTSETTAQSVANRYRSATVVEIPV